MENQRKRVRNQEALWGFILGLVGIGFHGGIWIAIPIVAVFLSVRGMMQIKQEPMQKGKVLAWIGLVLGVVYTFVTVAFFIGDKYNL